MNGDSFATVRATQGWKESLVMVERTILKELGFSFYVIEHAHRFILRARGVLRCGGHGTS